MRYRLVGGPWARLDIEIEGTPPYSVTLSNDNRRVPRHWLGSHLYYRYSLDGECFYVYNSRKYECMDLRNPCIQLQLAQPSPWPAGPCVVYEPPDQADMLDSIAMSTPARRPMLADLSRARTGDHAWQLVWDDPIRTGDAS